MATAIGSAVFPTGPDRHLNSSVQHPLSRPWWEATKTVNAYVHLISRIKVALDVCAF
jgi:hypothetical protein